MKKSYNRIYNKARNNTDGKLKLVTVGICAMDKKARSKPMNEIIGRLPENLFEIIIFGDDRIMNDAVETWPVVEVLIAFSSGANYPLEKVLDYVRLRHPFMINDLIMDDTLRDRRKVYTLLQANGIHVPVHVFCERDKKDKEGNLLPDTNVIEEFDEYIVVNGQQINKPLVEKPVDAENHNIYIYYPTSAGGGSKRLFRKVNDRSSEFYPTANEVRREGSYIYEEFIVTQGTDVKVYTVGPDYGHAEARKSPVVDGKVNRDAAGLEVRYPVILSPSEKEMSRKIVLAFKQTVCGFDILRVHGKSFCCDVNGFSFVKNSRKYYDDATQVLIEIMLNKQRPHYNAALSTRAPIMRQIANNSTKKADPTKRPRKASGNLSLTAANLEQTGGADDRRKTIGELDGNMSESDRPSSPTPSAKEEYYPDSLSRRNSSAGIRDLDNASADGAGTEELRCIIAITRHADRTPKQKIKFKVSLPVYLSYFHSYSKNHRKDLKVKSKSALTRFLKITQSVLDNKEVKLEDDEELYTNLNLIRDVLERWEISGINRKLQMKPLSWEDESDTDLDAPCNENEISSDVKFDLGLGSKPGIAAGLSQESRLSKFFPKMTSAGSSTDSLKSPTTVDSFKSLAFTRSISGSSDLEGKEKDKKSGGDAKEDNEKSKNRHATELSVILKWGGDLTPLGREQAEQMGTRFRHQMYPDNEGGGVLRLHATYRHDLKIKASDEGRVMKTAAAFAKGLLELEGQLTPIIASLVTIEEKNRNMLDHGDNAAVKENLDKCKDHLNMLQENRRLDTLFWKEFAIECPESIKMEISALGHPLTSLKRMHELINNICKDLQEKIRVERADASLEDRERTFMENSHNLDTHVRSHSKDLSSKLYLGETFSLMLDRWQKLNNDFFLIKDGNYDLSKIPDVYDMIRYDILHNYHFPFPGTAELYARVRALEHVCVPQEYGRDPIEKSIVGSKVCGALLEKIKYDLRVSRSDTTQDMRFLLDHSHADDLEINSLGRVVRTRLYFTSESHMHTLLNVLKYAGTASAMLGMCTKAEGLDAISAEGKRELARCPELSYCAQIVIRLFEEREDAEADKGKFRCEISFTPGANNNIFSDKSANVSSYVTLNKDISYEALLSCLTRGIMIGKDITPEEGALKMKEALMADQSALQEEVHDAHLTDLPYTQGGEDSPAQNRSGGVTPASFGSRSRTPSGDLVGSGSWLDGDITPRDVPPRDPSELSAAPPKSPMRDPLNRSNSPPSSLLASDLSLDISSKNTLNRVDSLASIGEETVEDIRSHDPDDSFVAAMSVLDTKCETNDQIEI
jgi:hypothetical protein